MGEFDKQKSPQSTTQTSSFFAACAAAASAAPTSLRCLFGGSSDQSLHMLLGNVSIVLVLSLNLPSFCLLGTVGLWRIRVLTLLWCKVGWSRCNSQSGLLCTSKWRLCSFAWSGYLACFGFARVHPPLRLSRFRWLPLGVPWVVRFSLASPWVWLGLFVLGFPPYFPPVVSCLPWGWLFVPGGGRAPRASRRHGVVSCGRCLLLTRALLAAGAAASAAPTSLRCPVGGSSDQSPHTAAFFTSFTQLAY